jgi:hypothetical protein
MEMAIQMPDLLADFQAGIMHKFSSLVQEWAGSIRALTRWEDEHLLDERPPDQKLAEHKKIVEHLMSYGQLFSMVTLSPSFDDPQMAGMVATTQSILRDKLRMFHHKVSPEEAQRLEQLLQEVFPEPGA